jgi:excisionase family DNA binding protein
MLKEPEKRTQRREAQPSALRVPEIAKHFGVSSHTVYQWITEGIIPERYIRRLSKNDGEGMRIHRDAIAHLKHYRDSVKSKANGLLGDSD